jgi:5-amino-6-(5-phosphoribosylamino)uracil reductase/diaminohydroxyphosphoribosylaminopyrimidine deaminase/5-amino-6-(5-phosphoribosylamino)uracil reductase
MKRPTVTLCYTQTLDGRLATATGQSQWIGGGESVTYAHQLRAEHDAIMVGVGTVLKDNPRLTVRHVAGHDPLRVVVDSTLRTPLDAAVLHGGAASGTLLAVTERAPAERVAAMKSLGAAVLTMPADADGRVSLYALMAALAERGVGSVMVEGGAALITALLRERMVDRMAVCVSPRIMGAGIAAVGDLGIRELASMIKLMDVQVQQFGADVVFDGRVVYSREQ